MKVINSTLLVFSCLLSFPTFSLQATGNIAGRGQVNMQGAIMDAACAIAVESREQTIDMDTLSIVDIIHDGQGRSKPFSIDLEHCVIERSKKPDRKQFQVTFDGDADVSGNLFGLQGNSSGIALQISDAAGNIAIPGKILPQQDIIPGESRLNYTVKLVPNHQVMKSGDYFSFVRFRLDYF